MSYYYSYYMGVRRSDDLIYPIGHFDESGDMYPIFEKSRNFASDLHDDFINMESCDASSKLRQIFSFRFENGLIKYLPISMLGNSNCIRSGYYLISDINQYESTHDPTDLFERRLSPTTFAEMLRNNSRYPADPRYSAEDFAYYAYEDTNSKEFETFLIVQAFSSYYEWHSGDNYNDYVVIETEG